MNSVLALLNKDSLAEDFQFDYVALSYLKPHLIAAINSIFENFIGNADA
ncbi:7703_t:CDS:2 [Funneliformis mosseae]|uniref:7703_t:CDS:1 n=1 Tax=Funneliformis mosseae TaxID=27381 RepID=A0A9N9CDH6_FUNMO|nr:7703_t:CDS:2 [Funneliformis mosseae]